MSVLVYTESWNNVFRKNTYETVSYAKTISNELSEELYAISFGEVDRLELEKLSTYGVTKVYSFTKINKGDSQTVTSIIENEFSDSKLFIFSNTYTSKMITSRLSIRLKAALITNVVSTVNSIDPLTVKRQSFSSKAIEKVTAKTNKVILSIAPNSYQLIENKSNIEIKIFDIEKGSDLNILSQENSTDKISLSEAEIIVSAGRGLKGPENWGMIEELASLLNAATACSKPVSDIGWRPHSEHVGQTGKAVSPNLYIAIGISGAIQHLAGVNSSKNIVVINTDSEAPFFKAANYGVVGDAFEVIPKMIEEIKKSSL
ncbi:MAG: electron transfer flavoprotein subunit alpha [Flavobacteriales bacterium]|nr:electron transfer flavoprotein subunit alpha [Flavobacteriales bacterium]|tara:strand:- start:2375 stop:3322 length:948 start_codon:yes stop_codon:yes gene_type:complete